MLFLLKCAIRNLLGIVILSSMIASSQQRGASAKDGFTFSLETQKSYVLGQEHVRFAASIRSTREDTEVSYVRLPVSLERRPGLLYTIRGPAGFRVTHAVRPDLKANDADSYEVPFIDEVDLSTSEWFDRVRPGHYTLTAA